MFRGYEDWAKQVIQNSQHQKPQNDKDAERLADAFTIMAGAKGAEMLMGGQMGHYGGGMRDDYRGRDSMGRFRYDGEMGGQRGGYDGREMYPEGQRAYWDDGRDGMREDYRGRRR